MKPWQCSRCKRKFASPDAVRMHVADKHKGNGLPERAQAHVEPDNESMADRSVQAQLYEAMGIYNPDQEWLI